MDSAITIMSILSPIGKFIYDNVGGFFSSGVIAIVGFLIKIYLRKSWYPLISVYRLVGAVYI